MTVFASICQCIICVMFAFNSFYCPASNYIL